MRALETKYKTQIREIVEANASLKEEQLAKTRRVEAELSEVKQSLTSVQRVKYESVSKLEREKLELQESERRCLAELGELRSEKVRKA